MILGADGGNKDHRLSITKKADLDKCAEFVILKKPFEAGKAV